MKLTVTMIEAIWCMVHRVLAGRRRNLTASSTPPPPWPRDAVCISEAQSRHELAWNHHGAVQPPSLSVVPQIQLHLDLTAATIADCLYDANRGRRLTTRH
jgi:hypothetical protein